MHISSQATVTDVDRFNSYPDPSRPLYKLL